MTLNGKMPDGGPASEQAACDQTLTFTLPQRDARGRVVRLGPVLEAVLSAHAYPPVVQRLLAETLVLTALMGSLLKDQDSQMTLQVQSENGPVDLLVCDYLDGALRGYVRHDAARVAALGEAPDLTSLLGGGYLAITYDLAATGQRYQGIVPIEGTSLAQVCQNYFTQSEQVPTLIRIATSTAAGACVAGGLLVQHLPDGEEGRERLHVNMDHPHWAHVATMAGSIKADELLDTGLAADDIVWRLFHEESEIRVAPGPAMTRGCRCTQQYYREVLARFSEADLAEMRDEHGVIAVDCAFCAKIFPVEM